LKILTKLLHDDFHRIIYPRSLGVPKTNKEEWLKHMEGVLESPAISFGGGTYHSVVEVPGKVVLHAAHKTEGLSQTDSAGRESIWIVEIVTGEDGSLKIKQIEQFTDSSSYNNLFNAAAEQQSASFAA